MPKSRRSEQESFFSRYGLVIILFLVAVVYLPNALGVIGQGTATAQAPPATQQATDTSAPPTPIKTSASAFGIIPKDRGINPNVLKDVKMVEVEPGKKEVVLETRKGNQQDVSWTNCHLTVLEAVKLAKNAGQKYNIPADVWLPMILSESSFHQWVPDTNGNCSVNLSWADAHGLTQIVPLYHPEVDMARADSDPAYNMDEGARIFAVEFAFKGSWDNIVAGYKGATVGDSNWQLWKDYQKAGGFRDQESGQYITWTYDN